MIWHQSNQYPHKKGVKREHRPAHLVTSYARCVIIQHPFWCLMIDHESCWCRTRPKKSKAKHKQQADERDRLDADALTGLFLFFVLSIQWLETCLKVETLWCDCSLIEKSRAYLVLPSWFPTWRWTHDQNHQCRSTCIAILVHIFAVDNGEIQGLHKIFFGGVFPARFLSRSGSSLFRRWSDCALLAHFDRACQQLNSGLACSDQRHILEAYSCRADWDSLIKPSKSSCQIMIWRL